MTELEQALEHQRAGRLQEAEAIYRHILTQEPDQPDALHLLGVIALQSKNHGSAVELIKRAVELKPTVPVYHVNFAHALRASREVAEAITAYRRAIALKPDLAAVHNDLGTALQEQGTLEEAIIAFSQCGDTRVGLRRGALQPWKCTA